MSQQNNDGLLVQRDLINIGNEFIKELEQNHPFIQYIDMVNSYSCDHDTVINIGARMGMILERDICQTPYEQFMDVIDDVISKLGYSDIPFQGQISISEIIDMRFDQFRDKFSLIIEKDSLEYIYRFRVGFLPFLYDKLLSLKPDILLL